MTMAVRVSSHGGGGSNMTANGKERTVKVQSSILLSVSSAWSGRSGARRMVPLSGGNPFPLPIQESNAHAHRLIEATPVHEF